VFATQSFQVRLFMALPSGCPFVPALKQDFPGRCVIQAPVSFPEGSGIGFSLLKAEASRFTEAL